MSSQGTPPQTPILSRRNSIANSFVIPAKLSLHTSSLPPSHLNGTLPSHLDIALPPLKSSLSYTSIRDLLPSATVNSPTSATSNTTSTYEIPIRNRLVKQAAWAYLQPMSSSPDSSGTRTHFLRRFWLRLCTKNPITACFRFISVHVIPSITNAFDRILRAIRVHFNR
ncbi:hypothetical protein NC652_036465 [Populus alba x Populus x berolinensis]|uniref:COPII coat assembly protein SEC16 n=1 Tax=Populus tomentosa TaxID=118781 RepID=A0A8X8C8E9_POPTO|nr:hypothetical protein POTOM_051621 [Populus tomentosa]KAJ6870809.1 hypothetical protein NC652_036465 [Populus alba x Populus x berolinensis]